MAFRRIDKEIYTLRQRLNRLDSNTKVRGFNDDINGLIILFLDLREQIIEEGGFHEYYFIGWIINFINFSFLNEFRGFGVS